MQALDEVILHSDIELVMKHPVFSNIKLSELVDSQYNTLLHAAAYAGRQKLLKKLLEFVSHSNDKSKFENIYEQTPRSLAVLAGYSDLADMLKHFDNDGMNFVENSNRDAAKDPVIASQLYNWKMYLDSGWNIRTRLLNDLNISHPLCSEIIPIVSAVNMTTEIFNREVVSKHIPVLIHYPIHGKRRWKAWKHWRRKEFIERYHTA